MRTKEEKKKDLLDFREKYKLGRKLCFPKSKLGRGWSVTPTDPACRGWGERDDRQKPAILCLAKMGQVLGK